MRVLLVGDCEPANRAGSEGIDLERRPDDPEQASGPDEIGALAGELRELERVLGDGGPDAVLIGSDSSAALAAVLVATKLGTPVAVVEGTAQAHSGVNSRLIRQLSDAQLAAEPASIVAWLRDTYTGQP